MRTKMLILIVLMSALCAPFAGACPPCDEPWTGTNNCTPEDRVWYCCIRTDQCFIDEPFDPWPIWQNTEAVETTASPEVLTGEQDLTAEMGSDVLVIDARPVEPLELESETED